MFFFFFGCIYIYLLVGKAVEWASKTIHASSEAEVGVRQSTADKVGGVSTDVAALVVTVDHKVQAHELIKLRVVESHHASIVGALIQRRVRGNLLAIVIDVAVDLSSSSKGKKKLIGHTRCMQQNETYVVMVPGEEGDQVQGIFEGVFPVFGLVNTIGIGLGEQALALKSIDTNGELGHGVKVLGQVLEHMRHFVGELLGSFGKLVNQGISLCLGRNLTGDQKPQQSLRQGLCAVLGSGELLLAFGDGIAPEADSLFGIEKRCFSNQTLDASHSTIGLKETTIRTKSLN